MLRTVLLILLLATMVATHSTILIPAVSTAEHGEQSHGMSNPHPPMAPKLETAAGGMEITDLRSFATAATIASSEPRLSLSGSSPAASFAIPPSNVSRRSLPLRI